MLLIRSSFWATIVLLSVLITPVLGWSDPRVDLYPAQLKFRIGLDDDVSGAQSQHVYIYVRNTGNGTYRNTGIFKNLVRDRVVDGWLYGPDNQGGSAGGPIAVGDVGKIFLRLPLGTLRHCDRVLIHIDTARNRQWGNSVFGNDRRILTALEMGNPRLCRIVDPIIPNPR